MTQRHFKVKKGDFVQVMCGKDKGKRGVIQKIFLDDAKVIVDGINKVRRHIKISQANPDGFIDKYKAIDISNVSLIDPGTDEPAKVGYKFVDGKKIRFFKKTDTVLDV